MIKTIKKKVQQLTCDHISVEAGTIDWSIYTSTHYYKCRNCGLYGNNGIFSGSSTRRNYQKLDKLWCEQRGFKHL